MCRVDYYIDVYPDGAEQRRRILTPCSSSRSYACQDPETYRHPRTNVPFPAAGSGDYYSASPRLAPAGSPRLGSPIVDYSNSESDHSRRTSGSGRSGGRRRESTLYFSSSPHGIEVSHSRSPGSGSRHYLHPHDSHDRHRRSRYRLSTTEPQRRGERVVIVENPPTPRTPPRHISAPFTAPSSPLTGFLSSTPPSGRRSSRRGQPAVIVDERRHVHFGDEEPPSRHRASATEERPRRRSGDDGTDRNYATTTPDRDADREREKAERIAQLNERISARPAVPIPIPTRNATLRRSNTTFDPVLDDGRDRERDIFEAMRDLDLGERTYRRRSGQHAPSPSPSQQQRESRRDLYDRYGRQYVDEEEEAQRRRLAERMMPRRRATVGPGARRHRVFYDDGMYRWE